VVSRFRELLAGERILVMPGAFDALSARLIERAGFQAYFIGGFALVGARYALPDIGLAGLGEIAAGVADVMRGSALPVMVDADNGYGDVKNVVHTVNTYERLGVSAFFMEDQVSPKRCGHMARRAVIPSEAMEAKLRAAAGGRLNPDTFIIARTDARTVLGMDEALRRGERYLKAGADGLFIESPLSVEELRLIGRSFDCPQLASMLEGGRTPILSPDELAEMGFRMAIYGISLLMRSVKVMQAALDDLKTGRMALVGSGVGFQEYQEIVGLPGWSEIENRYAGPAAGE